MVVIAVGAAVTAAVSDDHAWIIAAAILAGLTFTAYVVVEVIGPIIRRWRLKHPCHVYFNIPAPEEGVVDYVRQDTDGHHVKELTLPPNADVEIEIIYRPKLAFREIKFAFGCPLGSEGKPFAYEAFERFTIKGKSHWKPGEDEGHKTNRHKFYQWHRDEMRNTGSFFLLGFKLRTIQTGIWPMKVFFVTDEIEGSADLVIRVENKPTTSSKCFIREHRECYVYPSIRLPPH